MLVFMEREGKGGGGGGRGESGEIRRRCNQVGLVYCKVHSLSLYHLSPPPLFILSFSFSLLPPLLHPFLPLPSLSPHTHRFEEGAAEFQTQSPLPELKLSLCIETRGLFSDTKILAKVNHHQGNHLPGNHHQGNHLPGNHLPGNHHQGNHH